MGLSQEAVSGRDDNIGATVTRVGVVLFDTRCSHGILIAWLIFFCLENSSVYIERCDRHDLSV